MTDDDLSIQGTLDETTVPDLIRSIVRSSETAVLSLEAAGRNDTIYFSEGTIVYASTSDPDLGLGEILLRGGEIDIRKYDDAMEKTLVSRRIGTVLCELGHLQPEELIHGIERQASAIVLSAMSYRTGNYTIEFTSDFPEEMTTLPLPTERLILDGMRRIESWSLIVRGLVRMTRLLEAVPGNDAKLFHFDLDEDESHVLSLLTEPQTIETICARSYLSNFVTCRAVWALLTVNLVRDAEESHVDEKRAAVETEYELEETVERYNTAFQTIFALVFQKIGDHTYDFVDRVALHLSPETLPYLSGVNLLNEGRIDFDQIFNNLIASGSQDHSTVIHAILNELLYGWIIETKTEFGTTMEKQITDMVGKLKR